MKPERYQSAIDEMEATIKGHPGGWTDNEALNEVRRLADEIIYHWGSDEKISDKASDLKFCASNLYSARKHTKFSRNDESGTLTLIRRMLSNLAALRSWPQTRDNLNRIKEKSPVSRLTCTD